MKFEKFLKMTAGRGVLIDRSDGANWLLFDGVIMRIPDGMNVIAPLTMGDREFINHVFSEYNHENISTADLTDAELPTPDASASKVIRIFTDADGGKIGIPNKYFGLIEKDDDVVTIYNEEYDEENPVTLLILTGYGDNEEIAGMIFDDDYFSAIIHEKE